jgi:hypothetical protein
MEMIVGSQFSSAREPAQAQKESGCLAGEVAAATRSARPPTQCLKRRATGGFAIARERCSQHTIRVVTLFPNRSSAARHTRRFPQTPNQAPEPTRLLGPFFVSVFSVHHRLYLDRAETTLARVAHL